MKFNFGYEKLLQYYHQQEEIARRDYNESLSKLEIEKSKYQGMWDLHDNSISEIYELRQLPQGAPAVKLIHLDEFVVGQKLRIEWQRQIVINHASIAEQKQDALIYAAKEEKTLEKLKERKYAEFKKLVLKKERKANDELVVTRFKRGEDT